VKLIDLPTSATMNAARTADLGAWTESYVVAATAHRH
jgi:hypothetical protein